MRNQLLTLLAGLLLCLSHGGPIAADGTSLQRQNSRAAQLGWEAVGRLDMGNDGYCSATLIETDLVLTAAHCVYNRSTGTAYPVSDLRFRAGLRDGNVIAERQALQVVAHPGYDPKQGFNANNARHDVALVRLSQPVSTSDADPFVLHSGPLRDATVSVASYGRGRSDAMSRQRECTLLRDDRDLMLFDCNVTFGSSGAPVFANSGSRGRILSVISGMAQVNGQKVAVGMTLPARVAELKAMLRRAPVAAPDRAVTRLKVGQGRNSSGAKFVRPNGG